MFLAAACNTVRHSPSSPPPIPPTPSLPPTHRPTDPPPLLSHSSSPSSSSLGVWSAPFSQPHTNPASATKGRPLSCSLRIGPYPRVSLPFDASKRCPHLDPTLATRVDLFVYDMRNAEAGRTTTRVDSYISWRKTSSSINGTLAQAVQKVVLTCENPFTSKTGDDSGLLARLAGRVTTTHVFRTSTCFSVIEMNDEDSRKTTSFR